jgi:hypothetical protein
VELFPECGQCLLLVLQQNVPSNTVAAALECQAEVPQADSRGASEELSEFSVAQGLEQIVNRTLVHLSLGVAQGTGRPNGEV